MSNLTHYNFDDKDIFKVESLCNPFKCKNRLIWNDANENPPPKNIYVLIYHNSLFIVAYTDGYQWYDYMEYRITWLNSIKWWSELKAPNELQQEIL